MILVFSVQKPSEMPQEWFINFHTQPSPPVVSWEISSRCWLQKLQVTLIRLRDVLGGMAQTLPFSLAAFLAPYLVSQAQTRSELVPVWLTGSSY